jgi:hypothetical protein
MAKKSYNLLFDKPVSREECEEVLNSKVCDIFIAQYQFLKKDANSDLYITYVIKNINIKHNFINAIYLAIKIDLFDLQLIELSKEIVINKNYYLKKLLAFDYLNKFYNTISNEEYLRLNHIVSNKSSNRLVQLQVYINLLLYDQPKYFQKIVTLLRKENSTTFFYRLTYNLNEYSHFSRLLNSWEINLLLEIINQQKYDNDVKSELMNELSIQVDGGISLPPSSFP